MNWNCLWRWNPLVAFFPMITSEEGTHNDCKEQNNNWLSIEWLGLLPYVTYGTPLSFWAIILSSFPCLCSFCHEAKTWALISATTKFSICDNVLRRLVPWQRICTIYSAYITRTVWKPGSPVLHKAIFLVYKHWPFFWYSNLPTMEQKKSFL